MNKNRMVGVSCVAALSGAAGLACAQNESFWVAPVSGLWSDGANWTPPGVPGVPGNTNRRAVIDLDGAYTVALDFDAQVELLRVSLPKVKDADLDYNNESQAERDFNEVRARLRKFAKRKSCPPWTPVPICPARR